jgi:hypothetical protein
MKKLAAICLAALPLLGGCTVYGLGPAPNPAWAGYDYSYEYGLNGYDRPITYHYGYDAGYGGVQAEIGVQAQVGVGNAGCCASQYQYGGGNDGYRSPQYD